MPTSESRDYRPGALGPIPSGPRRVEERGYGRALSSSRTVVHRPLDTRIADCVSLDGREGAAQNSGRSADMAPRPDAKME
jgi:hypothetical protein